MRKGKAEGGSRPAAECGGGMRRAGLDPRRSAEEECGGRDSTRGGVRRGNAEGGTRPAAECGGGMRRAGLDPRWSAEGECGGRDSTGGGVRTGNADSGEGRSEIGWGCGDLVTHL